MKNLLTLMMVVMVSLSSFAQKDVTKFLGIPVDGTVSEMKQKLIAKGFKVASYGHKNQLEGTFNGREVFVMPIANKGKVWRIAVGDKQSSSETDIRIRFNNLCRQFYKNKKYEGIVAENDCYIPENEDISYEMTVNNKRYEAAFYQIPDTAILYKAMDETVLQKYTNEQIKNATPEQKEDINNIIKQVVDDICSKKTVWFMIAHDYGQYTIQMFYDNGYNQDDGEDL